jgi:hydroxypyruvate isomerase
VRRYSACIEWLFADTDTEVPDRIRAAKAAGLDAVEFWHWSNKDLDAVKAALNETGLRLAGILCEPIADITDPAHHDRLIEGVRASVDAARKLAAPVMIAQSGSLLPDVPRASQHVALIDVLGRAAEIVKGSGVVLALEPLNDRVDHPGYYLTSTMEGLDIVDAVGRPEVRLLYDLYHSAMMGERPQEVLRGRVDRVVHLHLADTHGRAEPGTGDLDWRGWLDWIEGQAYAGFVGLEYRPSSTTLESLRFRG